MKFGPGIEDRQVGRSVYGLLFDGGEYEVWFAVREDCFVGVAENPGVEQLGRVGDISVLFFPSQRWRREVRREYLGETLVWEIYWYMVHHHQVQPLMNQKHKEHMALQMLD